MFSHLVSINLCFLFSYRTVDQLWAITEDLNILYKENWTRLAAQEVKQFQVSDDDGKFMRPQNSMQQWSTVDRGR